ncbi:MAG: hypothetical protein ACI85Q_000605 [Salibacteraceae bacterium]|jgi:hypothetical protein
MKIKSVTLLFALICGLTTNVSAQEEANGEDFWSEKTSSETETKNESSSSREGATATVKAVENSCSNRDELREEVRLLIRPFRYNLAKTTTVNFKRYPQKMKVLVPIYSEQEHRIIFSTKGLPQDIVITVFDKPASEKKRKTLFTSNPSEPISTFELPADYKESYLHLEYAVPPSDAKDRSTTRRGCVVMMMGYLFLPESAPEETVTAQ